MKLSSLRSMLLKSISILFCDKSKCSSLRKRERVRCMTSRFGSDSANELYLYMKCYLWRYTFLTNYFVSHPYHDPMSCFCSNFSLCSAPRHDIQLCLHKSQKIAPRDLPLCQLRKVQFAITRVVVQVREGLRETNLIEVLRLS